MSARRLLPSLLLMAEESTTPRFEVTVVGARPARQLERASRVSKVEIDGPVLRCIVYAAFSPSSRHSMAASW